MQLTDSTNHSFADTHDTKDYGDKKKCWGKMQQIFCECDWGVSTLEAKLLQNEPEDRISATLLLFVQFQFSHFHQTVNDLT